jgi:hypothetical protein
MECRNRAPKELEPWTRGYQRYTGRSSPPNAFVGVENELTQGNIC